MDLKTCPILYFLSYNFLRFPRKNNMAPFYKKIATNGRRNSMLKDRRFDYDLS